jgi:hypothetical protein
MTTKKNDELDQPAITHEEYLELMTIRNTELNLKASAYDVQAEIAALRKMLDSANARLETLNGDIATASNALTERFKAIVAGYGFDGSVSVTVVDTTPHYITKD